MAKIAEILAQIEEKNNQVSSLFDKADVEAKGELTSEQKAEVIKLNKEIEQLELKATDLNEGEAMRLAAEKRRENLKKQRLALPEEPDKNERNPSNRFDEAKRAQSLGGVVTSDPEFKKFMEDLQKRGGTITSGTRLESPKVETKSLITGLSDSSAGAMVQTDYKPMVNTAPFQPLTLFDLITMGSTDSDLVEYVRILSYTNNAAGVPEATATSDGSGAKPESGMTFEKVTAAVLTVAHWIPATTRALADASQVRTLIDAFLRFGLRATMENMMLNGDGTSETFVGIYNTTGTQTQAWDTNAITTTRKARTKAKTPGRVNPNGWLMHPTDWETFDLLKDGEDRYYYGGPSVLGNPRLWGIPVVENENNAAGYTLLGDFRYAVLWLRMLAMISASNSHADFFVRNLVAILAEERAAFGVLYPKAFVEVDLTA